MGWCGQQLATAIVKSASVEDVLSLLGVNHETSLESARHLYKSAARALHPDKNPHEKAASAFQALSEAFTSFQHRKQAVPAFHLQDPECSITPARAWGQYVGRAGASKPAVHQGPIARPSSSWAREPPRTRPLPTRIIASACFKSACPSLEPQDQEAAQQPRSCSPSSPVQIVVPPTSPPMRPGATGSPLNIQESGNTSKRKIESKSRRSRQSRSHLHVATKPRTVCSSESDSFVSPSRRSPPQDCVPAQLETCATSSDANPVALIQDLTHESRSDPAAAESLVHVAHTCRRSVLAHLQSSCAVEHPDDRAQARTAPIQSRVLAHSEAQPSARASRVEPQNTAPSHVAGARSSFTRPAKPSCRRGSLLSSSHIEASCQNADACTAANNLHPADDAIVDCSIEDHSAPALSPQAKRMHTAHASSPELQANQIPESISPVGASQEILDMPTAALTSAQIKQGSIDTALPSLPNPPCRPKCTLTLAPDVGACGPAGKQVTDLTGFRFQGVQRKRRRRVPAAAPRQPSSPHCDPITSPEARKFCQMHESAPGHDADGCQHSCNVAQGAHLSPLALERRAEQLAVPDASTIPGESLPRIAPDAHGQGAHAPRPSLRRDSSASAAPLAHCASKPLPPGRLDTLHCASASVLHVDAHSSAIYSSSSPVCQASEAMCAPRCSGHLKATLSYSETPSGRPSTAAIQGAASDPHLSSSQHTATAIDVEQNRRGLSARTPDQTSTPRPQRCRIHLQACTSGESSEYAESPHQHSPHMFQSASPPSPYVPHVAGTPSAPPASAPECSDVQRAAAAHTRSATDFWRRAKVQARGEVSVADNTYTAPGSGCALDQIQKRAAACRVRGTSASPCDEPSSRPEKGDRIMQARKKTRPSLLIQELSRRVKGTWEGDVAASPNRCGSSDSDTELEGREGASGDEAIEEVEHKQCPEDGSGGKRRRAPKAGSTRTRKTQQALGQTSLHQFGFKQEGTA